MDSSFSSRFNIIQRRSRRSFFISTRWFIHTFTRVTWFLFLWTDSYSVFILMLCMSCSFYQIIADLITVPCCSHLEFRHKCHFLLAKRQAHVGLHVGDEMMVPASVLTTEKGNNSPSDDHSVFIYSDPCDVIFTGDFCVLNNARMIHENISFRSFQHELLT